MAEKLTPIQTEFINILFGKAMGSVKVACEICGIEDYLTILTDGLIEAIRTKADQALALSVPRAVHVIQKMLDTEEGSVFVSEKLHKVAIDVLDRVGLSKKERPSSGGTTIGLVFLPNKMPLPEPPKDEAITIQHQEFEAVI